MLEEPAKHIGSTKHFTGSEGEAFGQAAMGSPVDREVTGSPNSPMRNEGCLENGQPSKLPFFGKKSTDFFGDPSILMVREGDLLVPITVQKFIEFKPCFFLPPFKLIDVFYQKHPGVNVPNVWF